MKIKWDGFGSGKLRCWVEHGRKKISPDYPTISHCEAYLDGYKKRGEVFSKALARRHVFEDMAHEEAMEAAYGPHGQG